MDTMLRTGFLIQRDCYVGSTRDPSPFSPARSRSYITAAYFHSSTTSNYVRLLLSSGFASLPNSSSEKVPWSLPLEHVRSPELLKSYEEIVKNLSEALEFLAVIGVDRGNGGSSDGGGLDSAEVYLSHEVCCSLISPEVEGGD